MYIQKEGYKKKYYIVEYVHVHVHSSCIDIQFVCFKIAPEVKSLHIYIYIYILYMYI